MSDESRSLIRNRTGIVRDISPAEREIVLSALAAIPDAKAMRDDLDGLSVRTMGDGGMGSIRFVRQPHSARHFGRTIATTEFKDKDGILVSAALNVDAQGELFELDMWKVDFSPLQDHPLASTLKWKLTPSSSGTGANQSTRLPAE